MTKCIWHLVAILLAVLTLALPARIASAEWYVAGQFGVNLADQLSDIRGTGDLIGLRAPDFDLQNSFLYGGKVGVFPGNGWFGVELDAFHSTPHIKNLDDVPGVHMRVTNVGVNLLARYPGVTFQPYAGIGAGAAIARIGDSATTRGNTDVSSAVNVLLGMSFARGKASRSMGRNSRIVTASAPIAAIIGFYGSWFSTGDRAGPREDIIP